MAPPCQRRSAVSESGSIAMSGHDDDRVGARPPSRLRERGTSSDWPVSLTHEWKCSRVFLTMAEILSADFRGRCARVASPPCGAPTSNENRKPACPTGAPCERLVEVGEDQVGEHVVRRVSSPRGRGRQALEPGVEGSGQARAGRKSWHRRRVESPGKPDPARVEQRIVVPSSWRFAARIVVDSPTRRGARRERGADPARS